MMKRALDLTLAAGAMLVLSPVLAAVAIALRLSEGGPIFFRQERPGMHGRPFTMLKFRTMRDASGPDGQPLPDGERMNRLGRMLRATSIDELPALWNVLRGDMSLVGPRPLLMGYLPLYTEAQRRRHDVRPGITGWAQVNGRNALSWERRFRLDLWYVENRSFLLDLRILMLTVVKVFRREGIAQPGHATMEPFRGNRF
jgi:lipopolysaccharide/colanic/teichoic acid biosynthesis glycosyltransferase